MKSLETDFLEGLSVPHRVIKTIRLIGEFKGKQDLFKQQVPEKLEAMRQRAVIQSTESSNRIEGIQVPRHRLKLLMEHESEPRNRSEQEVAGYRDVLGTLYENSEQMQLSPNLILQLHRDLMQYASHQPGGQWKNTQNQITESTPEGGTRVRFEPVEPFLTAQYMADLNSLYKQHLRKSDYDPLIMIPLYLLDFLCIHPFSDGNGRMCRLLTVLLLEQQGYQVARYISLEKLIERTKESYYETLFSSDRGWHDSQHDPIPWIEYWLGIILAAYRRFESGVEKAVEHAKLTKPELVKQAIFKFSRPFSRSELVEKSQVSDTTARNVLRELRAQGIVDSMGRGAGARWFIVE